MKPQHSGPPTLPEILVGLSETHSVNSERAAARWFDRRVGRGLRLGLRWALRTKTGIALTLSLLAAAGAWTTHHLAAALHALH